MYEELKNILIKYSWLKQCAFALNPKTVIIAQLNYSAEINSLLIFAEPSNSVQSILIEENIKLGDIRELVNELNEFSEIYQDDIILERPAFYYIQESSELSNLPVQEMLEQVFETQKTYT